MSLRKIRWVLLPQLAVVAAFLFICTRCSPLNPSVEKTSITPKGGIANLGSVPAPAHTVYLVTKKLKIDAGETRFLEAPLTGQPVTVVLSAAANESPREFQRFKEQGKADIQLESVPSSESTAVFKVSIPSGDETLEDLSDFEPHLTQKNAGLWSLELSAHAMSHLGVIAMLANLKSIALTLKSPAPAASSGSQPAIHHTVFSAIDPNES